MINLKISTRGLLAGLIGLTMLTISALAVDAVRNAYAAQQLGHQQQTRTLLSTLGSRLTAQTEILIKAEATKLFQVDAQSDNQLRQLMLPGVPWQLITRYDAALNRTFPSNAVDSLVQERQQLQRFGEPLRHLAHQLISRQQPYILHPLVSPNGPTLAICMSQPSYSVCAVVGNHWLAQQLENSLAALSEPSLSLRLHSVTNATLSDFSQQLPSPFSGWQLSALPSPAQSAYSPWLLYSAIILPTFAMMVLMGWALHQKQRQMQEETKRRINFTGQLAHELRTPLANLRLYAELLKGEPSPEQRASFADTIDAEASRMGRLVDHAITLIRANDEQVTLHRCHPNTYLQTLIERLDPTLQHAGIELHTDLNAPHPVLIDQIALDAVVINLLDNICKYAPEGPVSLQVEYDQNNLNITVTDQGQGIPDERQAHLFVPYYQVQSARQNGFGLGLAVSRRLAERSGGSLSYHQTRNGNQFSLTLPAPPAPSTEEGKENMESVH